MDQGLIRRIQTRLDALGLNATQAARRAGLNPGYITEIMNPNRRTPQNGKRQTSPRLVTLRDLARALDCDVAYLIEEQDVPRLDRRGNKFTKVIGKVQAGAWFESKYGIDQMGTAEIKMVPVVDDPEFPASDSIAFHITGDAMNQMCPDGGIAIAIPLSKSRIKLQAGLVVVVEREDVAGRYETTLKQLDGESGAWRFIPRSTNPTHKPISMPPPNGEAIKIEAIVVRFIGPRLL